LARVNDRTANLKSPTKLIGLLLDIGGDIVTAIRFETRLVRTTRIEAMSRSLHAMRRHTLKSEATMSYRYGATTGVFDAGKMCVRIRTAVYANGSTPDGAARPPSMKRNDSRPEGRGFEPCPPGGGTARPTPKSPPLSGRDRFLSTLAQVFDAVPRRNVVSPRMRANPWTPAIPR